MENKILQQRFKDKMDGLKLSKKVTKEQLESMIWALDNMPELMECVYVRQKRFDEEKFNNFWERVPQEMRTKKKDAARHFTRIAPDVDLYKKIVQGLENQKIEKSKRKSIGLFVSEWPSAATWLYQRRWEDQVNLHPETSKSNQNSSSHLAKTNELLRSMDMDRKNAVVDMSIMNKLKDKFKY